MKTVLTTAALVALSAGMANANIIADAAGDFNINQGWNGWSYGYVDGSFSAASFTEMTGDPITNAYWADVDNLWTGGGTKLLDGHFSPRAWLHSNAPNSTRNGDLQAAVRRWTSYVDRTITLSGNIADNPNDNGFGDGVTAAIYVDGVLFNSWFIAAGDTTGVDYSFDIDADIDTLIDFVVEGGQDGDFDSVLFDSQITPTPGSLALIGLGGLVVARRRR